MKQRIVIEVSMADLKSRSKVMKIAVGVSGVEYAAITGPEKNLVEVVGDEIDVVDLTKLIRKKVAYAAIVSVGEAKKPPEAAPPPPPPPPPVVWHFAPPPAYGHYDAYWNHASAYDVRGHDPACNIM